MKRLLSSVLAGCTAALLMGAVAAPSAMAQTIKIGVLTPLTGTNAVQGEDILDGIKLAVKRINAGYEIPMKDGSTVKVDPAKLGGKLDLIIGDSESRPQSALVSARKLVSVDKVPVVVGLFASGICVPTGQFANSQKVVEISAGCSSPELRKIGPYFFNMLGLDTIMGKATGKFAFEDSGAKTFASIVPNNPFGVGMEIQSCKEIEKLGGKCITKVRYELGKSDYQPDVRRLMSKHAGAVLFTAYGTESRLILKEAFQMGISVKNFYADYPTMWSHVVSKTPQIAEGIKGLSPGAGSKFLDTEYNEPYEKAYGHPPTTVFGAYAYDSVMLTALAIEKAGKATSDAIKDNLIDVSKTYKGVTGDKTMDKDGMQINEDYRHVIYHDGKLVPYKK